MLENVLVWGGIGRAAFREGGQLFTLHVRGNDPVPVNRSGEIAFFADAGGEVDRFDRLDDLSALRTTLTDAYEKQRALSFTLSGLDRELSDPARQMCIAAVDRSARNPETLKFVRRRLFARPLPPEADTEGALRLAEGAPGIQRLYAEIISAQELIGRINRAFTKAAADFFTHEDEAWEAEKILVDQGVLEAVLAAATRDNAAEFNRVILEFGLRRQLTARIPRLPHFLTRLKSFVDVTEIRRAPERHHAEADPEEVEDLLADLDPIESLLAQINAEPGGRAPLSRAAKESVDRQIRTISALIESRDLGRLEEFLLDLVKYQVQHSRPEHIGMTFSRLAQVAIGASQSELASRLLSYASRLGVVDPVLSTQAGLLLHRSGNLADALAAYDETTSRFPDNVVAQAGRAEVLKEMGRLPEALEAYEEAIRRFPGDVVAQNGRAEVLKAMGRLPEALEAYEETIRRFPADVVAQTGRAEVLKEMGRLPEALAAYEETIPRFPDNVFAQNGRAEVLKEMGLLPEALAKYEEIIRRYSADVVAQTGRAAVLKEMGRLPEALAAYEETIPRFPDNVFVQNGRAEVLKEMGRLPEALAAYEETIRRYPGDVVAQTGRAAVLKEMGRLPEALAAYEETIRRFPGDMFAQNGRAEVLKGMSRSTEALAAYEETIRRYPRDVVAQTGRAAVLKGMGHLQEALAAYDETIHRFPADVFAQTGRAEVLKEMGHLREALAAYDETIRRFPENVVAQNGRAEVLKEMGRLPEALAAYDSIRRHVPYNLVARNGRSALLVLMGRIEEARAGLPDVIPHGYEDWIGLHIRCMSYVREGDFNSAVGLLRQAAADVPWPRLKHSFERALGVALMRKRDFNSASRVLESAVSAPLDNNRHLATLLLAHAEAEMGRRAEALRLVREMGTPGPQLAWLEDAIISHYSLIDVRTHVVQGTSHTLEEIEAREFELVLSAS